MSEQPLAARMRPRDPGEFVGQKHLVGPGRAIQNIVTSGNLPSMILWGPAGTGKTTLAHLLADLVGAEVTTLSAVSSGVADARKVMEGARGGLFKTVLFVDEVHRWSKAQQDVLLPAVEDGTITLIGATTENPYFSLNTPLLSRCLLLRLEPLTAEDLAALIRRALEDEDRGLGRMGLSIDDDALDHLTTIAGGDARMALTGLEAAAMAVAADGGERITLEVAADAVQRKAVVYDRQGDAHYDVVSAFIKSIRGSDPDAALFWLARMLEAGEDPRFIVRRLIVHASEDIGLADPTALLVAVAAAHAVEHVGLPEARLNLAQATLHLARAPKSNSVIEALGAAQEDAIGAEPVPSHLRDASYAGAKQLGHGKGYVYPHDRPGHHAPQAYRPEPFEGRRYHVPSGIGADVEVRPGTGEPIESERPAPSDERLEGPDGYADEPPRDDPKETR